MSELTLLSDFAQLNAGLLGLDELDAYYHGGQRLRYLAGFRNTNGLPLVINIPQLVVDSIEARLDVEGFRMGGSDTADDELWRVWQANDLDEWSQQAHVDALVFGRSYVLVWADEDDPSTPRITVESARQMTVSYSPALGIVTRAVKQWSEDDLHYCTVYTPDEVRRYVGTEPTSSAMGLRGPVVANPMGVVPVVPLVNRPRRSSRPLGESEMLVVLGVADAINELADSMMVSARYHAMPRRWATGIDLGGNDSEAERTGERIKQRWTDAEAGRVWLSDSSTTTFGQFAEADLSNYINAMDSLTAKAAALTGLPPHYFGQAGENPASADALRASEASLVKRALRKQRIFGGAWERVMRMALLVRDGAVPDAARSMETIWASPETPTVAQKADAAVKLQQAGIVTVDQAREDLGYTPEQRDRMGKADADAALGPVRVQLDEAARLQREDGLSQQAAFAAVGLLQAAGAIGQAAT